MELSNPQSVDYETHEEAVEPVPDIFIIERNFNERVSA